MLRIVCLTLATSTALGLRMPFFGSRSRNPKASTALGQGRGMLYGDITETIGDTPVVKISDKMCTPRAPRAVALPRARRRAYGARAPCGRPSLASRL
jgi:hypothetical protein